MAQQSDYPKTETQLREIQDALYQHSKEVYEAGGRPAFKGLLEIMSAESTIITAIHNIKGNHGSETPGVDSKTMRKDYLQKPFPWVVADIQRAFKYFEPQQIRRVYIDKPGKSEKRPLGIPAIRDRIVQECMRIVLEPILEAQFFAHSYGFRPMRDAAMALERVDIIMHNTGNYWIVEGDISKCFDRIDHSILIKRLYHMGIKDRRVLQIIKMVCWICLYFSPPFQSTRTARYSSHRRSGCHRPATPQCSSQCIRDRRCRCRSACSVCIFRRSSFVLLSSTGFLFLYILIITLLVAKVKFFPKKFCQKGT